MAPCLGRKVATASGPRKKVTRDPKKHFEEPLLTHRNLMAHIPEVSEHDKSQHMSVLIEQMESSNDISLVSWDSKKTTLYSNTAAQPEALKHLAVLEWLIGRQRWL